MLVTRFPGCVGDESESDCGGWRQQCWLGLSLDVGDKILWLCGG